MLKIYVCGPTVYNDLHIGNMVPILTFDLMLKAYRSLGKEFKFIHNITDIDDKIINRAAQLNISEQELSQRYTDAYLELLECFGVDTISKIEKVTSNINEIVDYVKQQVKEKNAYIDTEGNVWFDVKKFQGHYGCVSNLKLDKMQFEEQNQDKKFEADFALWKKTKVGVTFKTGDQNIAIGRPGWHTECAVLVQKHFGKDGLDIHGGGMDLTFPHHENENIQHFALYGRDITKNWIRCGQINFEGEKMSKSLGNVILAKDFIKQYDPFILKLIILNSKISAPINVTSEFIENMQTIEKKYKKVIFSFFTNFGTNVFVNQKPPLMRSNAKFIKIINSLKEGNFSDFNFHLNEQIKEYNKSKNLETAKVIFSILEVIHPLLTKVSNYENELELFTKWTVLKEKKDYIEADKIREKLMKSGLY
ncbi:class I tRNA ligase family protein [Mycoplasmopsis caviae]|uniref:Class I tRNA ligase family protein n=1 Tax=Mycoplasmopsis caviae TaxID=55603 RepID=A0A3P8KWN2_9BACT|nr:class I tRNA ligase family protein [Mycoplasmopsis caviae]UUD35375.1 class I tRNA ligase family protein [Mycoplasmopsis caviae]VDR41847.1 Cysteine--tRNA ligase [Mycoplasmopsis caviae]